MSYGALWATKSAKSGCGSWSNAPGGALWAGRWAAEVKRRCVSSGSRYPAGITATAGILPTSWKAYAKVLPRWQHRPCPKGEGQTNIVEAINCALRQRCGVLVRKSCSFSKSLAMHTARIKIVIDNYNRNIILN